MSSLNQIVKNRVVKRQDNFSFWREQGSGEYPGQGTQKNVVILSWFSEPMQPFYKSYVSHWGLREVFGNACPITEDQPWVYETLNEAIEILTESIDNEDDKKFKIQELRRDIKPRLRFSIPVLLLEDNRVYFWMLEK